MLEGVSWGQLLVHLLPLIPTLIGDVSKTVDVMKSDEKAVPKIQQGLLALTALMDHLNKAANDLSHQPGAQHGTR